MSCGTNNLHVPTSLLHGWYITLGLSSYTQLFVLWMDFLPDDSMVACEKNKGRTFKRPVHVFQYPESLGRLEPGFVLDRLLLPIAMEEWIRWSGIAFQNENIGLGLNIGQKNYCSIISHQNSDLRETKPKIWHFEIVQLPRYKWFGLSKIQECFEY